MVTMGALSKKDTVDTVEVIYLLIPPAPEPMSVAAVRKHNVRAARREAWSAFGLGVNGSTLAICRALGFLVLFCLAMYALYYLKSMLGIDLFADKHLEDFVPVPGYHRW